MLTDATFRTTPTYRRFLESLRHEKEPVYQSILRGDESEEENVLGRVVDWLYPLNSRRHVQEEKISRLAFRIAEGGSASIGHLRRRVNEIFDVAKLRDEIMNESAEVSGEKPEEFSADPKRNFLPHIVETAKKAGFSSASCARNAIRCLMARRRKAKTCGVTWRICASGWRATAALSLT